MKIKVFEAFAGYGSQAMALQRVAEAITKVKAEAKKDFEKQLADKQKELDEAKKLAEQKTAGEPAPVKHEDKKEIPDWYKADKAARDKELEELRNAYKVLSESHNALKTENDTFKAEKAAEERKNHIISKANELGIPQYRIDEGFVIPDNASDEAIADYLGKVANNIKAIVATAINRLIAAKMKEAEEALNKLKEIDEHQRTAEPE